MVGGHTLEVGNISSTSEITFRMKVGICDLATVAGSTARNLSLVESCYVPYQLQSTTEFPPLQGF